MDKDTKQLENRQEIALHLAVELDGVGYETTSAYGLCASR